MQYTVHDGLPKYSVHKTINIKYCLPSTPRSLFVGISPSSTPSGRGLKDLGMSRHFLTGAWDSTRFLNCVYTSGVLKALKENVQPLCLPDLIYYCLIKRDRNEYRLPLTGMERMGDLHGGITCDPRTF